MVLILELWEPSFTKIAAHGNTGAWGLLFRAGAWELREQFFVRIEKDKNKIVFRTMTQNAGWGNFLDIYIIIHEYNGKTQLGHCK